MTLKITPGTALLDRAVRVEARGLAPGERIVVRATSTDAAGARWSAWVELRAGRDGVASLRDAPVRASYPRSDPMGLFQQMVPMADSDSAFLTPEAGSFSVELTASVGRREVAHARAVRQMPAAVGVVARELVKARDGVAGVLYQPPRRKGRGPAVLLLGGSEGGLHPTLRLQASVLAAHGYPALALAYFGAPGLPSRLASVPLEYFRRALQVLAEQPDVDPDRLVVRGASFGGEAALLVAATYPRLVAGVVAQVPNSYVDAGLADGGGAAWSRNGRDLPHATRAEFGSPAAAIDRRAWIPVERIRGPILLACGELDVQWPSCQNVADVVGRLTAAGPRPGLTVVRDPQAGHGVGAVQPYTSITDGALVRSGGTVAATLHASLEVHQKLLELLADLSRPAR